MSSQNKSELSLRVAKRNDADLLARLHQECFPNYWNVNAFNDFFSVYGTKALLVEGASPAGMIVYRVQFEQAEIITICVSPHWRRRGIARLLLEKVMHKAKESGAERLLLDVEEGNLPALCLYEHYGFTQINRRKDYYRQKDGSYTDALVMCCELL